MRAEASAVLIAEESDTGDFAALVKVKVEPLSTVEYSLPFESIRFSVLLLAFLTVSLPLAVVMTTFEPLIFDLVIAAPREILSLLA